MSKPSQHPDPIVEEVRAARDAIAKRCDYDIDRIADAVRAREEESGKPFVRREPRKAVPAPQAS